MAVMLAFVLVFGTIACSDAKTPTKAPATPPEIVEPGDTPGSDTEVAPVCSDKPESKESLLLGRVDTADIPKDVCEKQYSNTTAVGF